MKQTAHPEDRLAHLNALFDEVRINILNRQHPISGLLPASTAVNAHGDYTDAWVRDNVYSILSAWGLGIAYRRVDSADARAYELEQATVKNMRGLLTAMMRQSDRVERFKLRQQPTDALHAKYDTGTGLAVVGDDAWGHLQLDATSLFVLMLVQMTLSGLKIIATRDEVNFIQNLVWYLSRAYATPDFGIWERGNKINHGQRELNASSLGMVLAALEAVNGFDLFGGDGDDHSRVFVLADDIARTEMTLNAILPRESGSKEVDAALLSVVGFPAFAVRDRLKAETVDTAVRQKLTGRFGCKRFLRDGHQTVLEDEQKLHYEPEELETFAGIESEWPLFFTYQLINHLFAGNYEAAEATNQQLLRAAVERDGVWLLPELYFVLPDDIEEERRNPGSTDRSPNDNQPLVWAQSLWVLGRLLLCGAIDASDLDPINRRHQLRGPETTRAVSVALIAETPAVDSALVEMGSDLHTLLGESRVRIGSVRSLIENLVDLGANERLGLSGRPRRRVLSLSTAKVYEIEGQQWLIVPQLFDTDIFYLTQDLGILVQELRSTIQYLHQFWQQPGRPILTIMISEWMLKSPDFSVMLSFLRDEVMRGEIFGVPVKGMPREVRSRAKAINFGIVYGISAFGLANQLGIARGEADDYIKKYFQRFPGIRDYMEATKEYAREHGYVETLFGRRVHIREIRSSNPSFRGGAERAAINAPIQGTAADIIRRAMIRMPEALAAKKLKSKMLLQVHDELVFEAPDKECDVLIATVSKVMAHASLPALQLSVPLVVDARAAANWDEAH